jgi:hypothetical protein
MEGDAHEVTVPLGLWELDGAGTVLHYEPSVGESPPLRPAELIGRNLFLDVVPANGYGEFRGQIENFMSGHANAHSFDFTTGQARGDVVRTRVLLARVRGRSAGPDAESILVHVRKA